MPCPQLLAATQGQEKSGSWVILVLVRCSTNEKVFANRYSGENVANCVLAKRLLWKCLLAFVEIIKEKKKPLMHSDEKQSVHNESIL